MGRKLTECLRKVDVNKHLNIMLIEICYKNESKFLNEGLVSNSFENKLPKNKDNMK